VDLVFPMTEYKLCSCEPMSLELEMSVIPCTYTIRLDGFFLTLEPRVRPKAPKSGHVILGQNGNMSWFSDLDLLGDLDICLDSGQDYLGNLKAYKIPQSHP
jgi:hypothetical protein